MADFLRIGRHVYNILRIGKKHYSWQRVRGRFCQLSEHHWQKGVLAEWHRSPFFRVGVLENKAIRNHTPTTCARYPFSPTSSLFYRWRVCDTHSCIPSSRLAIGSSYFEFVTLTVRVIIWPETWWIFSICSTTGYIIKKTIPDIWGRGG